MSRQRAKTLDDLHAQARITNRLLAAQLRERMSQQDLIKLLMSTDASDREIADILDTSAGTVSNAKSRLKRRARTGAGPADATDDSNTELD